MSAPRTPEEFLRKIERGLVEGNDRMVSEEEILETAAAISAKLWEAQKLWNFILNFKRCRLVGIGKDCKVEEIKSIPEQIEEIGGSPPPSLVIPPGFKLGDGN